MTVKFFKSTLKETFFSLALYLFHKTVQSLLIEFFHKFTNNGDM